MRFKLHSINIAAARFSYCNNSDTILTLFPTQTGASENSQWRKALRLSQLWQAFLSFRLVFQSYDLKKVHQYGTKDEWHELKLAN